MGLFAARPEEHDEWALPSEPLERDATDLLPETTIATVPNIELNAVSASASWVSFSATSLAVTEDSTEEDADQN